MPYDFKKDQKELYQPKTTPSLIDVPAMAFLMIDGAGDPNTSQEYAQAVQALYGLAYAIKMNKTWEGYFEFVVPPLEGLWDADEEFRNGTRATLDKTRLTWTAMLRQPDFVTQEVLEEAKRITARKKPELDLSKVRLETWQEGLSIQIMHIGPYDMEPASVELMEQFTKGSGFQTDFSDKRRHHEIYLSDPKKAQIEKLKTIIRHPVRQT